MSIGYAGLCSKHYARLVRYGDPVATRPGGRRPRIEHPSYSTVHQRIARDRGRAGDHECSIEGCGRLAQDWAYDHSDPAPRHDEKGRPYSTDGSRYIAVCRPHHRILDGVTK